MKWFTLLLTLMKLAAAVASYIESKQAFTAGQKDMLAKALLSLAARAKISKEIRRDVEAMSDEDLDAELRGD